MIKPKSFKLNEINDICKKKQKKPAFISKKTQIIDNKSSCTCCISLWHFLICGNWFAFSIVPEKMKNKIEAIDPEEDMLWNTHK